MKQENKGAALGGWLVLLAAVLASACSQPASQPAAQAQAQPEVQPAAPAATPPIVSFRVYRAIDSRLLGGILGGAGMQLGNTNAASAGGVLGYIHSEVVPSFAVPPGGRRFNDIDAIAVFEVRALNVPAARVQPFYHPPGEVKLPSDVKLFGPYMAFNNGMAMPPPAREQIESLGAYVGIQDQSNHPRHAYPGEWYSFVGTCPLSAWLPFPREKPSPCPTLPALENLCPASGHPDGSPSCQYTYSFLGHVPLDDLVGITSTTTPLCRDGEKPRACFDYTDFQQNGGVEYSTGAPNTMVECAGPQLPETGLPFWSGRCDAAKSLERIRALVTWPTLVAPKPPAG